MFKAGQDSNRLSLQRERDVWFLLQDSSGVRWVSVADSLEIGSWDLSQAEQCWTTQAVIQRHQWSRVEVGRQQMWCIPQSNVCVCACMCGLLAEGHASLLVPRKAEWYSVPADFRSKHLGTHQWFKMRDISKKTWNWIFVPCFLYWIFIIPCCHFLSSFI